MVVAVETTGITAAMQADIMATDANLIGGPVPFLGFQMARPAAGAVYPLAEEKGVALHKGAVRLVTIQTGKDIIGGRAAQGGNIGLLEGRTRLILFGIAETAAVHVFHAGPKHGASGIGAWMWAKKEAGA
ncbi:MAG: hypothetical protein C0613_01230 [Desulfobulbaceae bacterium]|nr:MAG: hypothetical protein C0613_01230 [Desulfobulbaceae bacterium]